MGLIVRDDKARAFHEKTWTFTKDGQEGKYINTSVSVDAGP